MRCTVALLGLALVVGAASCSEKSPPKDESGSISDSSSSKRGGQTASAQSQNPDSAPIPKGASWTILASEDAVREHGLEPIARIVDAHWAGLDPSIMGLGPVVSMAGLLRKRGLTLGDIDLFEINEAFAAQVLACLRAFESDKVGREVLGFDGALGTISRHRLNVDGGAIALGHPVGTSGNRITLHLARAMRKRGARLGLASQCIGGGLGGAMLLEAA